MVADAVITFRETLEAALVVGIILAYLEKSGNVKFNRHVFLGAGLGVFASAVFALYFGGFSEFTQGVFGISEQLFEGILLLIGASLLTWMILWMLKQRHVREEIEQKVKLEISEGHALGLALFVFVSVFREGIETVIFLGSASVVGEGVVSFGGALLGIGAALLLAFLIFETAMRVDLKLFFNATSVLLVLFAAGLVSQGVHEFEEAGVLQEAPDNARLWNAKAVLNEKENPIGIILKVLVGYDDNPTPAQAAGYVAYLLLVFAAFSNLERLHKII